MQQKQISGTLKTFNIVNEKEIINNLNLTFTYIKFYATT